MVVTSSTSFSWSIFDYETESICSTVDEYYLDRLFFGVETYDLTIIKSFTSEHLQYLCRMHRFFDSDWSSPAKEKQTAYQRACSFGYTNIVKYMLEAGVRIDQLFSSGNTTNIQRGAFMFACHSGSLTTIRVLLQALLPNYIEHYKSRNRRGLCYTSFARQHLISLRSEIEVPFSTEHVTPANRELDTINDWEPVRHEGFTPLHLACLFNRSLPMIKLLLLFGTVSTNPILQTSNQGTFADQMTTVREVIKYIRPQRLSIVNAQEQQRLEDLEQMQSGRPYQITIKPLSGQMLTLTVTGHTTTYELAGYIENEWCFPHDGQRLFFNGRSIPTWFEASQPLIDYNIKENSLLHIVWRNRN